MVDLKNSGKKLVELRESLNLDVAAAAKKGGLTSQKVTKIEKGGDPTLSELASLAKAYEYTVGGLVKRISS